MFNISNMNVDPQLISRIGVLLNSPEGQTLKKSIDGMDKMQLMQKLGQLKSEDLQKVSDLQNISNEELARVVNEFLNNKI